MNGEILKLIDDESDKVGWFMRLLVVGAVSKTGRKDYRIYDLGGRLKHGLISPIYGMVGWLTNDTNVVGMD